MRTKTTVAAVLLLTLTGCTGQEHDSKASAPTASAPSENASPASNQDDPAPLPDGPVNPGRYRYTVLDTCDSAMGCKVKPKPALPDVLVTVPAGWEASNEFHLVEPASGPGTNGPDGAGLVMGWTSYWVGLNSQPCSQTEHQKPDIEVGPAVADFVDAVVDHPRLDVTAPKAVTLGKYRGQFLTLTGPDDISKCTEWRPWDPSPYLQGPGNRWDLWVMDVDGTRVVIMAGYYPDTPPRTKAELRAMAKSIRFEPGAA